MYYYLVCIQGGSSMHNKILTFTTSVLPTPSTSYSRVVLAISITRTAVRGQLATDRLSKVFAPIELFLTLLASEIFDGRNIVWSSNNNPVFYSQFGAAHLF